MKIILIIIVVEVIMILLGINVIVELYLYYGDSVCYLILHNQSYIFLLLIN